MDHLQLVYLVGIVCCSALLFLTLCISVAAFVYLCIKDSSWIHKSYRNLTMITILLFTLSSCGDLVHLIIRWTHYPGRREMRLIESSIAIAFDSFYLTGNIMFYILLLSRIYIAFKLNKYVICLLIILIVIACIASLSYCVLFLIFLESDPLHFQLLKPPVFVLSVTDFILNIVFWSIFVYKLNSSIKGVDIVSVDGQNHINLISNVIIKHSILFGIALVFNQGFFGATMYYVLDSNYTILGGIILPYVIRGIENLVNVEVLWLILRINYNQYICLCKHCHLCVSRCCFKDREFNVKNPYYPLQDL